MAADEKFNLGEWVQQIPNAHTALRITGFDNGDGDGPHYFNLKIDACSGGEFAFDVNISLNNLAELKSLAESFNKAYYKAQALIESRKPKAKERMI